MNRKKWKRINQILRDRHIHHDQFRHINCVRPHPTETDEHWLAKCEESRKLYKQGRPFLTEVWTSDRRKRFDILDLEDDIDIEVETGKSKGKKYKADIIRNTRR